MLKPCLEGSLCSAIGPHLLAGRPDKLCSVPGVPTSEVNVRFTARLCLPLKALRLLYRTGDSYKSARRRSCGSTRCLTHGWRLSCSRCSAWNLKRRFRSSILHGCSVHRRLCVSDATIAASLSLLRFAVRLC